MTMERKEHYIVVSENEIVKAEMPLPLCWDKFQPDQKHPDIGLTKTGYYQCVAFQDHCLSLPRISIEGKHDWEVWQSVEKGKDFIFIERCCVEFHVLGVSECESSDDDDNPCKCSVAIPIQPTPEGEKVEEDYRKSIEGNYVFDSGKWRATYAGDILLIHKRELLNNDNNQTNKNGQ